MHTAIFELERQVREFVGFWAALPEHGPASLPSDAAAHRWIVAGLAQGVLSLLDRSSSTGVNPAVVPAFLHALEEMLAEDLSPYTS